MIIITIIIVVIIIFSHAPSRQMNTPPPRYSCGNIIIN